MKRNLGEDNLMWILMKILMEWIIFLLLINCILCKYVSKPNELQKKIL